MKKCEICRKNKGSLWSGILCVCSSCFDRLMQKKLEKARTQQEKNQNTRKELRGVEKNGKN